MIPRRVSFAILLAFICHGPFILAGRYRLSYDAFTHMFFADHYAGDWFSLWETRWFTGFEVVSYPPLVHQIIGLSSHFIGIDPAYALFQWLVLTAYPLAVYSFGRIFSGRCASAYAAIGTAFLSSLYYAAYAFGQLPTLTATLFTLFGLSALADFLRAGNKLSGSLGIGLMTITMATHHATLLFLPWGLMAVVVHILVEQKTKVPVLFSRLFFFGLFSAISAGVVIWPFWKWGTTQEIQTPIDHLSRHNFLQDPFALMAFFLPVYGCLMFVILYVLWKGFSRRYIGLTLAFLILLILGLGGTTSLPHLLFGSGWEWLTYDRFAFWATLILVPFLGIIVINARRMLPGGLSFKFELSKSHRSKPIVSMGKNLHIRTGATVLIFAVLALTSFLAGSIPGLLHTQPDSLDMQPIVNFLNTRDNSRWRYLTFGFGDQMALLSRLTNATTIDGSYFTARTLPELRESGIALIDTAFWSIKGIAGLDPILEKSGDYGVRWGFVNRREYVSELKKNGWIFVRYLENGVQVWENPGAVLPQPSTPPKTSRFAELSWGILPLSSLLITMLLAARRLLNINAHSP